MLISDLQGRSFQSLDGLGGSILGPGRDPTEVEVEVRGERLLVPANAFQMRPDGSLFLAVGKASLPAHGHAGELGVVEERLNIEKRTRQSRVVVKVIPEVRTEPVDVPLLDEKVEVKRVPVNKAVEGPVPARTEGETTIIPVYEEALVVERRLMLKEEIHITRHRSVRHERQDVQLRSEKVQIERREVPDQER